MHPTFPTAPTTTAPAAPDPAVTPAPPPPPAWQAPPPPAGAGPLPPQAPPPRERRSPGMRAIVVTALVAGLAGAAGSAVVVSALDDDGPAPAAEAPAPEQPSAPARAATTEGVDWTAVAEAVRPSVVAIAVRGPGGSGEGSGVVVSTDGRIVTNDHVVGGGGEILVTLVDGRVYEAEVVGTDPTTDVALIALVDPPDDLVAATWGDSEAVVVGQPVMAVGNPLGLDSTVTTGIVSAVDRPVSTGTPGRGELVVTNAIQVDAAINPGNSGGPLFDADGRVVGITSSILTTSRSSGSIGLGFAIPSDLARRVAAQLEDGPAEHAYLGVALGDGRATADGATRLGAVVRQVGRGTPAEDAGLEPGDVVVAIDGEPVSGAESLTAHVREREPGARVELTVVRDGESRQVQVTLAAREEAQATPSSRG